MMIFLMFFGLFGREIKDGDEIEGRLTSWTRNSLDFEYVHEFSLGSEFVGLVSCFSDVSDPVLLFSNTSEVSLTSYQYRSSYRNSALIRIPSSELVVNTKYYIRVVCEYFCEFRLRVSIDIPIVLRSGVPISGYLATGQVLNFSFESEIQNFDALRIKSVGNVDLQVFSDQNFSKGLDVYKNWIGELEFVSEVKKKAVFIRIVAAEFTNFAIDVSDSDENIKKLQPSRPVNDFVIEGKYKMYSVYITEFNDIFEVFLTVFSGDGNLYVGFTTPPHMQSFDLASIRVGNDFLKIEKSVLSHSLTEGNIFIAVHGAVSSSFSIVVRLSQDSSVSLSAGVPQSSTIFQDSILNYHFEVFNSPVNLIFSLTIYNGDADLYVKFCETRCSFTFEDLQNKIYKAESSSALKPLKLSYKPTGLCNNSFICNYAVAAFGNNESLNSLTVSTEKSKVRLQQGQSFIVACLGGEIRVFEYSVVNALVAEVEFEITVVDGELELCSGRDEVELNRCEKKLKHSGIEADQIVFTRGEQQKSIEGLFLVAAECYGGCYYSIVVRETIPGKNSSVQLISGYPQKETLDNSSNKSQKMYYFDVGNRKSDIKINLLGHRGYFSMQVANVLVWDQKIFESDWETSTNSDNDHIFISKNDPRNRINSIFIIIVQCNKLIPGQKAIYTIQYTMNNDIFILTTGISVPDQIQSQEYAFYSFPLQRSHTDIKISLIASSGDPDLFISIGYVNSRPSKNNFDIKSKAFGSESLTLLWDETLSRYCANAENESYNSSIPKCFLFLSLYSEYAASYTIRVSLVSNLPQYLKPAESLYGGLTKNEFDFYYTYISTNEDLFIFLQNIVGETDFFLTLQDSLSSSQPISSWPRPSNSSSKFKTPQKIHFSSTQLQSHCNLTCLVLISINCNSPICNFYFENSQIRITKIAEGQSFYGLVSNDYEYYQYLCDKPTEELLVVLTPLEPCSLSLFVSKGKSQIPSQGSYDWTAEETLKILPTDPKFITSSMIGIYTIAVKSESQICAFTLTVTNHELPLIILTPGVPHKASVLKGKINYYAFFNTNSEKVRISLTPSIGSPFLLLSVHKENDLGIFSDLPNEESFVLNSNYADDKYSLSVGKSDSYFCEFCYYLIGVASKDQAIYTITGITELHIKLLQDGVPYKTEMREKFYQIYKLYVNVKKNIHVSIAEYSGTANFFVALEKDSPKFVWEALFGLRTKSLVISSDDERFTLGTYYITVISESAEVFYSIVYFTEDSYISLVDGWPMVYSLDSDSGLLKLSFDQSGSVFCMLESLNQYLPTVFTYTKQKNSQKKVFYAEYSAAHYTGEHLAMDFQINLSESLLLHVKKPELSLAPNEFSFYCTKSFHPALLTLETPAIGHLTTEKPALRYEITLIHSETLNIYITPCEGAVKLQVSTNWTVIKDENPFLTAIKLMNGAIVAKIEGIVGKVFLTVQKFSVSETATYKIFVDSQGLERLYPGNNGFIDWDYDRGLINLHWEGLEYANSSKFLKKVKFFVFFSEKQVPVQSSCEVMRQVSKGDGKWLAETDKNKLSVKIEDEGFVTVVARVQDAGLVALKDVIYEKIKVVEYKERVLAWRIVWMIVGMVIVVFLVSGVMMMKYRKVVEEKKVLETQGKQITCFDETNQNDVTRKEV